MKHKILPLTKTVGTALSIACSFALNSCSDSKISSSDITDLSQAIFVVSETYRGEPYKQYATSDAFYVNVNEKVRISGYYALNGEFISTDKSIDLYNTHKWTIEGKEYDGSAVYYTFESAGIHKISFETVDHYGDTLRSYADIYVNTPSSIALQSPSDGYNEVDGNNEEGLELVWTVYGIDSWETSSCTLYASYDKEELWQHPLGWTSCTNTANLMGTLDPDYNENGKKIDHSIENSTIYWGVQASIKNNNGAIEQAYSDIFSFSTKLQNDGEAIIEIPVVSHYGQYPEKSRLNGAFVSATGDTLLRISGAYTNSIIKRTLTPQSNLKIIICDSIRTEYGCSSMLVDLPPSTKTITDTLFLEDTVKPNMVPAATEIATDDMLVFYILDNDSGVNTSKIFVTINDDTLHTTFDDYTLSFENPCKSECDLSIYAEDYARNKAPDVYWKITVDKKETYITGPFAKTEDK